MTVTSETSVYQYTGNGVTTAFSYPTLFFANDDGTNQLQVILGDDDVQVEATDYTVTGAGLTAGGTVTFTTAPTSGTRVTIKRSVPITQETDYAAAGKFPAESHEAALDKLTMEVQQLKALIALAISQPAGAAIGSSLVFPSASDGKIIGWDGTALANLGVADFGDTTLPLSVDNGGTGATTEGGARTALGLDDVLYADVTDELEVGYSTVVYDAGTKSTGTFTPDEANGQFQKAVNGGAHTLAPPANDTAITIKYTNNGSAGAITTSGFDVVTGDIPDTTDTNIWVADVRVIDGWSQLHWTAGQ